MFTLLLDFVHLARSPIHSSIKYRHEIQDFAHAYGLMYYVFKQDDADKEVAIKSFALGKRQLYKASWGK